MAVSVYTKSMSDTDDQQPSNPEQAIEFMGTVREAQPGDAEQLRPILETWIRDPETGQIIEEEVSSVVEAVTASTEGQTDTLFLVAEDAEDRIIGMMGLRAPSAEMQAFTTTENPAELINAYVDIEERGSGAGRALLQKAEITAKANGHTELIVNSGPRYEQSGWPFWTKTFGDPVAIQRDLYGPGRDAPVWRKEL